MIQDVKLGTHRIGTYMYAISKCAFLLGFRLENVTRFGITSNNAIEHVFMYKLIKINIPINMYIEVIFTTPISLQWKGA